MGRIIWLENQSRLTSQPKFVVHDIDPRPGAIHVPIVDLNQDGLPDFIALISQQYETVVAFVNAGKGDFIAHTLFEADHPNWGSSGIDLVDLDDDGDQDLLYANGDSLDDLLLKPYHGIQWLENLGELRFRHHRLTDLYGAHIAKAADLDSDGDLDVIACAYLPFLRPDTPNVERVESLIWLEQTTTGAFRRHSLEARTCHHPTLDVGDIDKDGNPDIVVGNMTMTQQEDEKIEHWITIWRNLGIH